MKLRPANSFQVRAVETAETLLRDALTGARLADCPKLCEAIRHAINSCGGAIRHAKRRQDRTRASRPPYGVLHVTRTDRSAFANIEQPEPSPAPAIGQVPHYAWMDRADCGIG